MLQARSAPYHSVHLCDDDQELFAAFGRHQQRVMTGYGQPSDRAATRDAGFHVHLVKPVDIRTLVAAIAMGA